MICIFATNKLIMQDTATVLIDKLFEWQDAKWADFNKIPNGCLFGREIRTGITGLTVSGIYYHQSTIIALFTRDATWMSIESQLGVLAIISLLISYKCGPEMCGQAVLFLISLLTAIFFGCAKLFLIDIPCNTWKSVNIILYIVGFRRQLSKEDLSKNDISD